MNRKDFVSGKGKDELEKLVQSQIFDLEENGTKKILLVRVLPDEDNTIPDAEALQGISDIVSKQVKSMGLGNQVAVLVAPKYIEVSLIDLEKKNG